MESLDLSLAISPRPIVKRKQTEFTNGEKQQSENVSIEFGTNSVSSFPDVASLKSGKSILKTKRHSEIGYKLDHHHGEPMNPLITEVNVASSAARRATCRKPLTHWTEEEHELFLMGIEMYGRGQWKKISETYLLTRTPSQISSHAQSHFKRNRKKNLRTINFLEVDNCTTSQTSKPNKSSTSTVDESDRSIVNPVARPTLNLFPVVAATSSVNDKVFPPCSMSMGLRSHPFDGQIGLN
ncbi:unnamed protein product [Ilex paraguariensis]|uniref:Uncharacterized protein n=1 Tax=Ilex paraguariensis TaxID=185542 RepID=A0ABC8R5M4_9AQUA